MRKFIFVLGLLFAFAQFGKIETSFANTKSKDDVVKIQCTSCSMPFGSSYVGQPVVQSDTIHFYDGTGHVSGPTLTGSSDFKLTSDGCSGASLHNSVCSFTVTFTPTSSGSKTATLSYHMSGEYDDPTWPPYNSTIVWSLTGNGIRRPASVPSQENCGSIVKPESRELGERIPVTGCNFDLNYISSSASGYGSTLPVSRRVAFFNPEGWSASIHHFYDRAQGVLYRGTGNKENLPAVASGSNYYVVSADQSEVYVFNSAGMHLYTKTGLKGATKYTFGYDTTNHLITITDAYSNITDFNRDTSGVLTSISSPYNVVTNIWTNTAGLISSVQNPKGETYSLTYKSGTELLETFQKPGGQTSTFTYDSSGKLSKDEGHGGNFWNIIETASTTWPIEVSTAEGIVTKYNPKDYSSGISTRAINTPYYNMNYSVDADGNTEWSAEGTQIDETFTNDERFGYANNRKATSTITYASTAMTENYSQAVAWPSGVTADWFNFDTITSNKVVGSQTTSTVYDSSTSKSTTTTPEGAVVAITVNSNEKPSSLKVGNDTAWSYSYDSHGRLSQTIQGSNNGLTYAYNSKGYLQSITNLRGEVTSYTYDLAGRVTQVTLPDTRVVTYTYNSNGNLTGVTPPSKPLHGFTFNAMELVSTYAPPALTGVTTKDTTYTYNLDKKLTQITRPTGATVALAYDSSSGLLSSKTIAAGSFSYTYLTKNRISQVSSPDDYYNSLSWYGTKLLGDAQWKTSTNFLYGKASYTYDSQHRINSRTFRGNQATNTFTRNYAYNDDGQILQAGDLSLTYTYPSGRLSTTTINKISDSRTYDTYGNLQSYTATYNPTSGSPQTLYSYTLTRDSMGRISGKSETVQGVTDAYTYSYDTAGRLTEVLKNGSAYSSYVYDTNGNRTSGVTAGTAFTATYDDQDRMLTYNSRSYSYNANGDLTQIVWSPGVISSYVYDAMGSLKQSTLSSGNVLTYGYDGFNRRAHKLDGSTLKYHYIYEGSDRIAGHVNNAGAIQREYVYGSDWRVPDYVVASSVNYRIIKDHLGSVRLVVKTDDGTVTQRLDYNDLGEAVTDTNSGFQAFGFAGGVYDGQTRLVKFGARDYDPRAGGRWTSKDPTLFDGADVNSYEHMGNIGNTRIETNLYGYSFNDPINFIDSNGKFPWLVAGIIAGVMYATDLETPGAAQDEIIGVPLAAAGTAAAGPACKVANANRYLRVGPGRNGGNKVFRASGQVIEWLEKKGVPGIKNGHLDIFDMGPL